MPRFHAGFSVGTVAGRPGRRRHGRAATCRSPRTCRGGRARRGGRAPRGPRLPAGAASAATDERTPRRRAPAAHCRVAEPRTLLVGLFVLAFAFAEGAGNDWISVALIDGYGASAALGRLGFATVPRGDDGRPLVRPGAARPPRAGRVVAGAGRAPASPACCCSLGRSLARRRRRHRALGRRAALGFPVGMSAAADEPAPRRVAGQRRRLDRLRRVPRRTAADRLPRRARDGRPGAAARRGTPRADLPAPGRGPPARGAPRCGVRARAGRGRGGAGTAPAVGCAG